jgi:hypothetical protein
MPTKNCTALAKFAVMSLFLTFLGSAAAYAQKPAGPKHVPVSAGQTTDVAGDAEAAARDSWRAFVAHNSPLAEGCFRASYPNLEWEQVECTIVHPRTHPTPRSSSSGGTVGNGLDYVAESAGLISETVGTFPSVTGVTSEQSVGGSGGILGPNEYSLQLNTNFTGTTAACAGITGCTVWQQFIYATDYSTAGQATVFMQYWLIGWGSSACPSGYNKFGNDCFTNSSGVTAPDMAITSLGSLSLSGTAVASGNDTVVFNNGTTAYSVSASDSQLDIAQVWNQSEFNIVGDAGGSQAQFNSGSSVTVNVALTDGSTAAPTCAINGTTGETNNLTLGICSTAGGSSPSIQFDEGNQAPTITSANHTTFTVGAVGMFQVTGAGDPPNTFSTAGPLPNGIILSPSGLLFGTPAAGTGGIYTFTITASNGVAPNATQTFTLTVDQAPAITSGNSMQFTIGIANSFLVTGTGFPAPTFSTTGPLPTGVTLSPSGLLSGTAAAGTAGTYNITIIASNGVLPNATQSFTITVVKASTACAIYSSSPLFTVGQPLTFTAYVTISPLVVGSPSGKVSFIDSTVSDLVLGRASLVGGNASIQAALKNPTHRQWIMATYPGDASFLPCKSPDIAEDLR